MMYNQHKNFTNSEDVMADLPKTVEQHSDEIDLTEIIRALWDKKIWIILTTFVTTLLAGIYAFTAKEQWTSKATVIAPTSVELGDYLNIRREYNRILRQETIEPKSLSESLFNSFNRLAQSSDIRNDFFTGSAVYKKLTQGKDEQAQRLILSKLSSELTNFKAPDTKKDPNAIGNTITFSADNPIDAQDTLKELIEFINTKALKMELDDFLVDFQNLLISLKYERTLIQEDLSVNKSVKLDNLNKAYETAIKAGIKEYSKILNDDSRNIVAALSDTKIPLSDSQLADSSYLFMLGEKYLKAQIDVANEKGVVYPPRYYQIDYQIEQLELLLEKVKTVTTKAYRYQASPDYPVNKDKPKTVIILSLGVIVGGVLGGLFVLFNSFFRKVKNK